MENDSKPTRLVPTKPEQQGEAPLHISGRSNPKSAVNSKESPFTKLGRVLSELQRGVAALAGRGGPATISSDKVIQVPTPGTNTDRHTHHILENRSHERDIVGRPEHTREATPAVHRMQLRSGLLHPPAATKSVGAIGGVQKLGTKTGSLQTKLDALSSGYRAGAARHEQAVPGRGDVARPYGPESIRMPSISIPRTTSRQHVTSRGRGSSRGYQVVTGADAEAHRHVIEQVAHDSPGALPSAARLAHILRTEELIRRGDAEPNELISSLAQAIRAGDRRPVADIEPAKVQQAIHASLGGETRASQLLNTPESTRLIERYQNTMATIRENLHQTEQRIERSGSSAPNREGRTKLNTAASVAAPARAHSAMLPPAPTPRINAPAVTSTQNSPSPAAAAAGLETMISTNEEPHAFMAGQAAQVEMETSERESRSPSRLPKMPSISARSPESVSMSGATASKPVGSTISAPLASATKINTTPVESKKSSSMSRMELSGKMTIVGPSGQVVGEGSIDGSMRGR